MPINKGRIAKALSIGAAGAVAVILLTTCIISAVFLMLSSIPKDALPYIMLAADAAGAFVGGCIAAAVNGSKGLAVGLSCGSIVFLIFLVIGLLSGAADIGAVTFIKLGVLLLFGALGGIKGVNRKEKLHIK